jgi:glyoxylate/hydroxypyruvate reductase A
MHILLRINDTNDEIQRWQATLSDVLPDVIWHPEQEIAPEIADQIEIAVVANPPPGSLRGYPRLRFVQSLWAGVDSLLADDSIPTALVVARMVDPAMSVAMAETALWATLSLHRGFFQYAQQQRCAVWHELPQRRASDLHVTVLGCGAMGRAAAQRIAAQGYQVVAWRTAESGRDAGAAQAEFRIVAGQQALADALSVSDIVINLLPLTDQTRGLMNQQFFHTLPVGASVVNLGRGGHLIESDLLAALDTGHLHHAVLDVFHVEPLPNDHVMWRHPKITVLPHMAAITDPRSASKVVAKQIRAWSTGQSIANRIEWGRGY